MATVGRLHLATPTREDDDLYSGYDNYHPAYNTANIEQDEFLQEALKSSHGKRSRLVSNLPLKRLFTIMNNEGFLIAY